MSDRINAGNFLYYMTNYEDGTISFSDFIDLFHYFIDTGLAWSLQGPYERAAKDLIEAGLAGRREVVS